MSHLWTISENIFNPQRLRHAKTIFTIGNGYLSTRELFESAYLDGASHWTAFYRLAIPLSVPAIASLGIFQFLWIWNDLLVALVFLGGQNPVLTYQISNMVTSHGSGWHLLTAAAFISIALPMLVFFGLQRFFVRGLLAGSVKG